MPKSGQLWNSNFLLEQPLFSVFEPLATQLRGAQFPSVEELTQLAERQRQLRAPDARTLRFAPMVKKPRRQKRTHLQLDQLYDGSIHLKGEVPCLAESYHDLFNALAFAAFVRSKRALHERQFLALKAWVGDSPQLPGKRTREQDALTIFDEGGVVLLMADPFLSSFRNSTTALPVSANAPESGVVPLLFGHALIEHLFEGHEEVRASAVVLELNGPIASELDIFEIADQYLESRLRDRSQFTEPGADAIFTMSHNSLSVGPPKPSWTAWNPDDERAFVSNYKATPK